MNAKELGRLRVSIERSRPYGTGDRMKRTASEPKLEHAVRVERRQIKRDGTEGAAKNEPGRKS
jgi:hypothetical protein